MKTQQETGHSQRKYLCTLSEDELTCWLSKLEEPKFRARQIMDWIYKKWVLDPNRMKNVPQRIRKELNHDFTCGSSSIEIPKQSTDGTRKFLIRLEDGETIESVIIPTESRATFCLSTQVGCPVGCKFCASGVHGLTRNLNAGEIVEQFILLCIELGRLPDNLVIMGIGEGLLNFNHLVNALEIISDRECIGLGSRRITVSTSGWVPGIRKLAQKRRQWNLAVSLHAPNDSLRAEIIPEKFRYPINEIIDVCKYFFEITKRMITFEYVLLKGVNDHVECAEKLAVLAEECKAKVNLIPYNGSETSGFEKPEPKHIQRFKSVLRRQNIPVTERVEKGSNIDAACGQLRTRDIGRRTEV